MDALYANHVLHSLAIARYTTFRPGTHVLDVGTGGGFPGIPLAILFPDVSFHLVDSIGKKMKLVQLLADELKLQNASTEHLRVEQLKGKYNYIVSRAVAALPVMYSWVGDLLNHSKGDPQSGGILYLKGGEFADELRGLPLRHRLVELHQYFEEPFFATKKLVHLY